MDALRRTLLRGGAASAGIGLLIASGLLAPRRVIAAEWNRQAFGATTFPEAIKAAGLTGSQDSRDILINGPEIAENGAQVTVEISSSLPGSQTLSVFVEKNPFPLAATLVFANGAVPHARLQLKMAESSRVRAVIRTTDGKNYHASREIKVTLGGCGN